MRLRAGVPYSDRDTTLSLLPGAAVGQWLAGHRRLVWGRLLDAGCGNRPYGDWYGPLVDSCVCLDAAPGTATDVVALADRLPFAAESFDTVLATELLEHVEDPVRAVAELARVLRPGGHLIVTVPFLYPTHEAPFDYYRFTHYGVRSVLERQGLEVLTVDAKGGVGLLAAHAMVLAVVAALRGAGRSMRRPLLDVPAVRALVWGPQEGVIRLRGGPRRRGVRGTAGLLSLGYMAVARRPAAGAPPAAHAAWERR